MDSEWHSDRAKGASVTGANGRYLERAHDDLMKKMSVGDAGSQAHAGSGAGAGWLGQAFAWVAGLSLLMVFWFSGAMPYLWLYDYALNGSHSSRYVLALTFLLAQLCICWFIFLFIAGIIKFELRSTARWILGSVFILPLTTVIFVPLANFSLWLVGRALATNVGFIGGVRESILSTPPLDHATSFTPTLNWTEINKLWQIPSDIHVRFADGAIGLIVFTAFAGLVLLFARVKID